MGAKTFADITCGVQIARTQQAREAIFRLRYDVYIAECGKHSAGADDERRWLIDALDDASDLLFVEQQGALVGSVRRTYLDSTGTHDALPNGLELERFPSSVGSRLSLSSRFVIHPSARRSRVATALSVAAYALGRDRGVAFDFLTTNPGLVPLCERLGYQRYTAAIHTEDVGILIPMVLVATEYARLRHLASPFLHAAALYPERTGQLQWLHEEFSVVREYDGRDCTGATDFRALRLLDRVQAVQAGVRTELLDAKGSGYVHRFDRVDVLVRAGDPCTCAFVVLDGTIAEVRQGLYPIVATNTRAAIAAHDVVCVEDTRAFCIPQAPVQRGKREKPASGERTMGALLRHSAARATSSDASGEREWA